MVIVLAWLASRGQAAKTGELHDFTLSDACNAALAAASQVAHDVHVAFPIIS